MPEREDRDDVPLEKRVRELEAQVDRLVTERTDLRIELDGTGRELARARELNDRVLADNRELTGRIERLTTTRSQLPVSAVGDQLRRSLVELGRDPAPADAPLDYVARAVRFDLRANLGFDDEGVAVLRFPAIGEQVADHDLATIHLEFDATPRRDVDLGGLVPVPHVVGLPVDLADAQLTGAGLVTGERHEAPSSSAPGTVLAQDPPRGAYADPQTPVDLTVAVPRTVTVPRVTGLPRAQALATLEGASLTSGRITSRETDEVDADVVLEQRPAAGDEVAAGAAVDLTVASSPKRIAVPPLRGRPLAEATAALEGAGLVRGTVGRLRSEEPPGTVLRQDPAAGEQVRPGTAVDLVVAELGIERSVATPEVLGRHHLEATEELRAGGWGVHASRAATPAADDARRDGRFGTIVGQQPVAGQPVPTSRKLLAIEVVSSPAPLTDLRGVGRATAERLATSGVRTVGDLALLGVDEVAELLDTTREKAADLHEAARMHDLAYGLGAVAGVDDDLGVLLVRADVRSPADLAAADPAALGRQLRAVAERHPPTGEPALTAAALRSVIEAARRLVEGR